MTDDCARVRAYPDDKDRINDLRQGDDTQADVVARLLESPTPPQDDVEAIADALADDEVAIIGAEATITDEIASRLEASVEGDGAGMTYDDVKAACAAAIRDELPVEEMGR